MGIGAILRRSRTAIPLFGALLARFRASRRGVSGVEFALIVPVLSVMFLSAIDLSRAATAASRASFVAESIAGLVAQADHALTPGEIDGFILLAPLINPDSLRYGRQVGITNLQQLADVTVSSVAFVTPPLDCKVNCTVTGGTVFSRSNAGRARPCGLVTAAPDGSPAAPTTVPQSLFGPDALVVVDVVAKFKPFFLTLLPTTFERTAYFRPRTQNRIDSTQNCLLYRIVSARPRTTQA